MLWTIGSFLIFAAIGHVMGAVILYASHRWIFHGKLGKLPLLREFKRLHLRHHRYSYSEHKNEFLVVPLWAKTIILSLIALVALIQPGLSLGLFTFALLYSHRHYAIHNEDNYSHFHFHHHYHHKKPNVNYSGVYPILDNVFGTHESPPQ